MGLFREKKKPIEADDSLEKLKRAVTALEQSVSAQASAFRILETEWLNTHDKFKHIMGRLGKRDQAEREALPEPAGDANTPDAASPFDHLDPVSKKIMERRTRR